MKTFSFMWRLLLFCSLWKWLFNWFKLKGTVKDKKKEKERKKRQWESFSSLIFPPLSLFSFVCAENFNFICTSHYFNFSFHFFILRLLLLFVVWGNQVKRAFKINDFNEKEKSDESTNGIVQCSGKLRERERRRRKCPNDVD